MATFLSVLNFLSQLGAIFSQLLQIKSNEDMKQAGRKEVEAEIDKARAQDASDETEIAGERPTRDDLTKRLQDGTF